MRMSTTARFVSHPAIHFSPGRRARSRPRLGLIRSSTVYHRAPARVVTVGVLRSHTSRYRFAPVGPVARTAGVRATRTLGCSRGRRG